MVAEPIPVKGDPIDVLAEHYLKHSPVTSVLHFADRDAMRNAVRRKLEERKAAGVLVSGAKFCHPAVSDSADIVAACEKDGIPYLKLEFEEGMTVFGHTHLQVEALLEARAALPFAGTENGRGH